ncbi:MAG: GGDEF domain-containing response regulator [Chloroflexota bacterium]
MQNGSESPPEILVIEDDLETRELLRDTLEDGGFAVRVAEDGARGLAALRERSPSLIIIDQLLPDLLGSEVCRHIRGEPRYAAIPVVILTSLGDSANQLAAFGAGADDYVVKPFEVDQLVARLHSHVRRSIRERQLSPLTGLPGNLEIDHAIASRLAQHESFAVGWIDIDNFKVYNDRYGFFAGDQVIERTGRLVRQIADDMEYGPSFAGHIGGDDFVLVVPLELAEQAAQEVVSGFDVQRAEFYSAKDLERGHVMGRTREGAARRFPLISVSVAVVPCPAGRFQNPAEIAQRATEIKHFLKQRPGSGWMTDRRAEEAPPATQSRRKRDSFTSQVRRSS